MIEVLRNILAPSFLADPNDNWEDYLVRMAMDKEWGIEIELVAIADVLGVQLQMTQKM